MGPGAIDVAALDGVRHTVQSLWYDCGVRKNVESQSMVMDWVSFPPQSLGCWVRGVMFARHVHRKTLEGAEGAVLVTEQSSALTA